MIKNLNRFIVFTVFFSLFLVNGYAAAPTYKLIDLGLQESDRSEAVAVNDVGQVAGMYWMFEKKYYFFWEEKSGIRLIDLPETAIISVLNNAGQIAGNYNDASGKEKGFIWDQCSGFFDIGTLGGSFTRVHDMNDHGQIVGESESSKVSLVDENREQHAFLWQCGCMQDLGALTGDLGALGDRSQATSINNQGQIIGTSNSLIAHKRKYLRTNNRAVAWQNGVIEEVDQTIDLQDNVIAVSINNKGLATYYSEHENNFVIDLSTKIKTKISSNLSSWIVEINDKGDLFLFHKHMYAFNCRKADRVNIKKENTESDYVNLQNFEYICFYRSFNYPNRWKQDSFHWARDFNINGWVVGEAENIYGERHGVLLVPVNE